MQMSMVQLFVWLIELFRNGSIPKFARTVYCIFAENPNELHQIKDQYYLPFLHDIQVYAKSHLQLTLVLLDQQHFVDNNNIMWCDMPLLQNQVANVTIGRRNCQEHFWWGHCGSWFPTQDIVDEWRQFLAAQVLQITAPQQPLKQQRPSDSVSGSISKPLQVLILDRAPGYRRSLLDPIEVVTVTREVLCPHHTIQCNLTYTQLELGREGSYTWQWNCRFWAAGWDVVILVHGAALSNAICLCNNTLAVVEFVPRDDNKVSMYEPLLQQMGVADYQAVRFRQGAHDFNSLVQPDLSAFREALQSILMWLVPSHALMGPEASVDANSKTTGSGV